MNGAYSSPYVYPTYPEQYYDVPYPEQYPSPYSEPYQYPSQQPAPYEPSVLPDTPTQLPLTGEPGQPYAEPVIESPQYTPAPYDTGSDPYLQPTHSVAEPDLPLSPSGLPYIPDYMLDPSLQPTEALGPDVKPPGGFGPYLEELTKTTGPLEVIGEVLDYAGDVLKTGLDIIWDVGKHIIEHLEIGYSTKGVPQLKTPYYTFQYPTKTSTVYSEVTRLAEQGQVTGTGTPTLGAQRAGLGDLLGEVSPKTLLIGGGALLLYLLTRK